MCTHLEAYSLNTSSSSAACVLWGVNQGMATRLSIHMCGQTSRQAQLSGLYITAAVAYIPVDYKVVYLVDFIISRIMSDRYRFLTQNPVGHPSLDIFDGIIYHKGASIIRMLYHWIGREVREAFTPNSNFDFDSAEHWVCTHNKGDSPHDRICYSCSI